MYVYPSSEKGRIVRGVGRGVTRSSFRQEKTRRPVQNHWTGGDSREVESLGEGGPVSPGVGESEGLTGQGGRREVGGETDRWGVSRRFTMESVVEEEGIVWGVGCIFHRPIPTGSGDARGNVDRHNVVGSMKRGDGG